MDKVSSTYVVIGPTKVGKTAIISMLQTSIQKISGEINGYDVVMVNPNRNMKELNSVCRKHISEGRVSRDATSSVRNYKFLLEIKKQKTIFPSLKKKSTFLKYGTDQARCSFR